jgi:hypothetical protein
LWGGLRQPAVHCDFFVFFLYPKIVATNLAADSMVYWVLDLMVDSALDSVVDSVRSTPEHQLQIFTLGID